MLIESSVGWQGSRAYTRTGIQGGERLPGTPSGVYRFEPSAVPRRSPLADAADTADHYGSEDEPQRGAPEDEAKTEVMPTRDAEQLVARLVQEVKEPSEDRGREHLGQGERHVPQRHVSSSRLLAIGKHVAGERPVDGVVGTVADAVEDAEDIEKSERADEAEEQDGYDNGLHGARDIDEQLAPARPVGEDAADHRWDDRARDHGQQPEGTGRAGVGGAHDVAEVELHEGEDREDAQRHQCASRERPEKVVGLERLEEGHQCRKPPRREHRDDAAGDEDRGNRPEPGAKRGEKERE